MTASHLEAGSTLVEPLHCNLQARYEPPFLSPHRLQLSDWGPLLGALESLIMRCAALESILESDEPLLHQAQLADTLGETCSS